VDATPPLEVEPISARRARGSDQDTLGAALADIATPLVRPLARARGIGEQELRAIVRDEIDLALGADAMADAAQFDERTGER
jgi:hypothetical protein